MKGKCLNLVQQAPFWCAESKVVVTHFDESCCFGACVDGKDFRGNQLRKRCNGQEARRLKARKIRRKDHDHMTEKTTRREALEDPDCEETQKEHEKQFAQKLLSEKEQPKQWRSIAT